MLRFPLRSTAVNFLSVMIDQYIKEKHINYYEFNEFKDVEEVNSGLVKVYRANWKQSEKYITLKSFSLDNITVKEIIYEIKLHQKVDFNDNIIKFHGITKTDSDKGYLLVIEYVEGGTLRNYLEENFSSLNWQDKYRLALQLSSAVEYLHEKLVTHKDLHSKNILVQQNSIKLADSGLSKRIEDIKQISSNIFDTIPYIDPRGVNITREKLLDVNSPGWDKQIEKLKKSDVYSVGVLFWELSSGKKPFTDKEYDISLAMRIAQGFREEIVESTPKKYSNLYAKCWDDDPDKRLTIQEVVMILKSMISTQQTIQHLKLNHGLSLNGHRIEPSKKAVFVEDGLLNMSLYKGQPLVYTFINDRSSHTNLLRLHPDDKNILNFNEDLQPSDVCINFPIAEITYSANLLECFSSFMCDDEALHEMYGHLFAEKVLVGGKLFIDNFTSLTSMQIDSFKSFLTWVYDSAKFSKENPFNNLFVLDFFPKMRTSDGKKLNTPEELINWMNNLYQKNMADIISYNNLVPISRLRFGTSPSVVTFRDDHEKLPGVANFRKKLSLKEWVKDSIYVNLTNWVKEFHLLQGLTINDHFKLGISKKIAINFTKVPNVDSSDKLYLEMVKPKTNLEEMLINIKSFPFIKNTMKSDDSRREYVTHFLVKCERYKIIFTVDKIKPSEKFKQSIERALESMKPHIYLQYVFDEYGKFYPSSIVLGKSLKIILPSSSSDTSDTSKRIDLESPTFESLKSYLDHLNIPYPIEKNDFTDWIQNNDLKIIEFGNIIPLCNILEVEQRRKIDIILNNQDSFKVIMTGIVELEDLDVSNIEYYKRINVEPSLDNENYEVFGSIISEDNLKLNDIFVTFGLYSVDGFSAMINKLAEANVNIEKLKKCCILWMIIGIPSKLSVFSPKNRECEINYFKTSITLRPNQLNYHIKTPFPLPPRCTISFNVSSTKFKNSIKLINSSYNSIGIKIDNSTLSVIPNSDQFNELEIAICILSSDYENLKIDNRKAEEYSLDLIGYNLNNNFSKAQEYINQKYPTKVGREKEIKLIINKQNLKGRLDLSDFINLEELNCSDNQLTSLDVSKNTKLTDLDCSQNQLTNLDVSNCSNVNCIRANYNQLVDIKLPVVNEKLEYLSLLDNSISQRLSYFSPFINLKELLIGNTEKDRFKQDIYNQFHGSLKPLENLVKLENLNINNTDIDSGLEYLPDSIKNLRCLTDKRSESRVRKIYEQLEPFAIDSSDILQGRYNLRGWKKNWKLAKEMEKLTKDLEETNKELKKALQNEEILLERFLKNEQISQNKDEQIDELKEQLDEVLKRLWGNEPNSQDKLATLDSQLKGKEDFINRFQQQSKQQIDELKGQLDEVSKRLCENEQISQNKDEQINELEGQLDEVLKSLCENEQISQNKDEQIDELKEQLDEVLKRLWENEPNFQDKLATLNSQLKDKEDFINRLQQNNQQVDKLKRQLSEISRSKDDQIDELKGQLDEVLKRLWEK